MITVNLKIELSNLDKAMTEIKALENMVLDLAKTYPTTFVETIKATDEVAKKTPRKPRTKKAEVTPEDVKPAKEVSEPVKEEKTVTEPTGITLDTLTKLAQGVVKAGFRAEAKALIGEFSTSGKLSSVPEENYAQLETALKAL